MAARSRTNRKSKRPSFRPSPRRAEKSRFVNPSRSLPPPRNAAEGQGDSARDDAKNERPLDLVILKIAEKIAREYRPEKIILFGSHAWGTPGPDSDVDLFVVKEDDASPFDRIRAVKRLLYGSGVATDVLVYTPEQLARRRAVGDPFIRDVLTRGRTLYAR